MHLRFLSRRHTGSAWGLPNCLRQQESVTGKWCSFFSFSDLCVKSAGTQLRKHVVDGHGFLYIHKTCVPLDDSASSQMKPPKPFPFLYWVIPNWPKICWSTFSLSHFLPWVLTNHWIPKVNKPAANCSSFCDAVWCMNLAMQTTSDVQTTISTSSGSPWKLYPLSLSFHHKRWITELQAGLKTEEKGWKKP